MKKKSFNKYYRAIIIFLQKNKYWFFAIQRNVLSQLDAKSTATESVTIFKRLQFLQKYKKFYSRTI